MERYGDIRKLTWRGRQSTRWYVRVHKDDGKSTWRCTGFADPRCAEAIVQRWQLDAIAGRNGTAPPMVDALMQWQTAATCGRSHNYARLIRGFLARVLPLLRACSVSTFSEQDVMVYIEHRIDAGYAPTTTNLDIVLLRAFMAWCIRQRWRTDNPVVRRLHVPVPRRAPRVLSMEEEARLLAAAEAIGDSATGYVLCLLLTGFRSWLSSHIGWEDVDLGCGMWHIPAWKMKSRREYCQPVAPQLLVWLRAHAQSGGPIFVGGRRMWYCVRTRAGLPDLKRHDLRRHFVTKCRRAGIEIEITMALSDHSDVRTMMAFYRRVDLAETKAALERLDAQRNKELPMVTIEASVCRRDPVEAANVSTEDQ